MIYYYRLRANNGFIEQSKIIGSPTEDKILDLRITFNGLYILALMGDQLLPHKFNDRMWGTQNSKTNIAVIWMDFDDDILDIEGYDITTGQSPYPMKLFVPRVTVNQQSFVMIAPRTNELIDANGGFQITYFTNGSSAFSQFIGCGLTCSLCSPSLTSKCLVCRNGYYLYKNQCYITKCPDFSYQVYDDNNNPLPYCRQCHYSCKTCSGPREDQCTTCCTNNTCGPILNRVPNSGKCECPAGLSDSNGLCVQRCILNLAGKRNGMCYPQCPANSFPSIQYDQLAQAQDRSQYDSSSQTDCQQSAYHLRFSATGKGLPLIGPPDLDQVPEQFTIAFWVRPITLNTQTYFVNAFDRIHVTAQGSTNRVFFMFRTGASTYVQPTYNNDARQRVTINTWNYVVVSQKQILNGSILRYEQQLAIANSNVGAVNNGGFSDTQSVVHYPLFVNTIYIGAHSDINPQSFSGFMKEFQLFTKYHGFRQIQDEQLRMYRHYSYDDPNLVAYWKFTEAYNSTDPEYKIRDYSKYQNSITYSRIQKPDYPQFQLDQSLALSLCIFHDVNTCMSPSYRTSHPLVIHAKRLTQKPYFDLRDSTTLTKAHGDQVWFMAHNKKCDFATALAYMTYQGNFINDWVVTDPTKTPLNLKEGNHYQVCYYIAAQKVAFNVYQVYLVEQPETVDPSNSNAFMSDGVTRTWNTYGGDQAYGDVIRFAVDCSQSQSTDYEMQRTTKPTYGTHTIRNFGVSGDFFFCWQPTFIQESSEPYYAAIHDLRFRVVSTPAVSTSAVTQVNSNEDMIRFDLRGTFADGDRIAFSWKGTTITDCNPTNFIGVKYTRNYFYWPSVWFGYDTGIYGIQNYTMDELHVCYQSSANDAPQSWSRIKKTTGASYQIQVKEYNIPALNGRCPELVSFIPAYGSTELYETDNTIKFNFKSQAVYPSRHPDNTTKGSIAIYRGAVRADGTIFRTDEVLWSNTNLDDFRTPNPFQQGDLICSGAGACSIILSAASNRMKGGEIYYLSFFKNSFAIKSSASSTTRYYLFNDKTLDKAAGQTTGYDHLFFCRSFFVNSSSQMINGKTFVVNGIDLKSIAIRAASISGSLQTSVFTTKAINLIMTVVNTIDPYCVLTPPVATVSMESVTQTSFTVENLVLRQCNVGALMANVEVVRGIQDQDGVFTHIRSEWQKGVQLGVIGCDSSCLFCNGTTENHCLVCSNLTQFMHLGRCYNSCPAGFSYFIEKTEIFQRQFYTVYSCLSSCPLGYYPDYETNECLRCNSDCQTCNNNYIASCLTCEPIKYLYNGICLDQCPSPHHQNNFTSYNCDQISSPANLKVKIQSLGYKSKIPKDIQAYLKVAINNDGGGSILSIMWEQLEPVTNNEEASIFSISKDGDVNNRDAVIRLKMTAFNFMSTDQVVKVKVTVQNSIGEIAYDIYEFYQNSPPVTGNVHLFVENNIGMGSGVAIDTIYRVEIDGFDDIKLDNELPTMFKLYMKSNGIYYTVSTQFSESKYYFRLPFISTDTNATQLNRTIQLCVAASNHHEATAYTCQRVVNVMNSPNYLTDRGLLVQHLKNLSYTNNMTNIIYASNLLYTAMQSPKRSSSAPGICTLDYHCNYNGKCSSQFGNQRCVCQMGFSGTFCQFRQSQLPELQAIAERIIIALKTKLLTKFEIKPHDIEIVGNAMRGLMKDPDLITDEQFENIIQILEIIGQASIYAHFPVIKEVRDIYMDGFTQVMNKLFHSYSVRIALPKTAALEKSGSLNEQYAYQQSQGSRRLLASNNDFSSNQEYLIGGIRHRDQRRKLIIDNDEENDSRSVFEKWSRRIDTELNNFIKYFIPTLNPTNTKYTYMSNTFDLAVYSLYASNFKYKQMYIREKDLYWEFPKEIFDNVQGQASDKQEVTFKAMKYTANPFIFESNPGAFVETNVTTLSFYDTNGDHIPVTIDPSIGEFIQIKEPYRKTQGFEDELLRCMAWNNDLHRFISDDSCSVAKIHEIIPCFSFDEDSPINTTVSVCRCTHLSTFAAVYQQTVPQKGQGLGNGIYSDFFAMQYWQNSFGFLAAIAGACVFVAGHFIVFLVDMKLQPKVLEKLRERMRKLELKGFTQKPTQKKLIVRRDENGQIIFIRNKDFIEEEKKDEPKKGQDLEREQTPVQNLIKPNEMAKPSKKKVMAGKKFKQDSDQLQDAELIKVKGKKLSKKPQKGTQLYEEEKSHQTEPRTARGEVGSSQDNPLQNLLGRNDGPEVHDIFEQQMLKRYEEEKEVREFVRVHGTSSSEEDMDQKQRSREQKRYLKIEKRTKELYQYHWKTLLIHGNHISSLLYVTSLLSPRHVRWTLLFTCILLNSEPLISLRKNIHRKQNQLELSRQNQTYPQPKGQSSTLYLHEEVFEISWHFTIAFASRQFSPSFNWFWCAVIYNNTKDPLSLPDFDRSARDIAGDDLWIAIIAPIGTIIVMYIFAGFFKVSNLRLLHSYTTIYLEQMLVELNKEMKLRFIIAYMITVAIYAAILWYIIKFTATFGWKVSWSWWYSGCFSIFLQFVIYDNFISILHWVTYNCSRTLALFWMKVRELKQGRAEA